MAAYSQYLCALHNSLVRHKGGSTVKEDQISVTGGCLCGELRYEAMAAPFDGAFCHCSMCRKSTGSLFSVVIFFNRSDFHIVQGEPKYFRASEFGRNASCGNCSSIIFGAYDESPSIYVYLGSLDNPDDWPVIEEWSGHVFVDDKVSWYEIKDGLPQHSASVGYSDTAKAQNEEK